MKKLTSHFVIKLLLSGLFLFDVSSANAAQTLSQPLDNLPSASQMKGTVLGQCVYGGYCNGTSTKTAYNGVTYMTDVGSPVYAVCDGTVKKAQRADRFIVIDHSNCGGFASLFSYYGNIDLGNFKAGSMVTAGQQIGTVANSKKGGALHLSFNTNYVTSSLAYTPIGKTTLKDCTQESVTQRRTALDAKGYLDPILIGSQSGWNPVLLKGGDVKTGCEAPEQLYIPEPDGTSLPYAPFPTIGYTKIANDGSKLADSALLGPNPKDWACTRDNKTGLIWEVKTTDGGLRDMNKTYNRYAGDDFVNSVNVQTLCGKNDWQIPSGKALLSIVKLSSQPTIDGIYFPNTKAWQFRVSSLSNNESVNFSIGGVSVYSGSSDYGYGEYNYTIRLVRQDLPETPIYTKIANDGSLLPNSATLGSNPKDWACTKDNKTGLIWEVKTNDDGLRDKDLTYTWYEPDASKNGGFVGYPNTEGRDTYSFTNAVNATGLCGAHNWRLPTKTELDGLVFCSGNQTKTLAKEEYGSICTGSPFGPTIYNPYFQNTNLYWYWSSSSPFSSSAVSVDFYIGDSYPNNKNFNIYVRLVR